MTPLTAVEKDQLLRTLLKPDDDCAHNVAPLWAAVDELIAAREAAALRAAADSLARRARWRFRAGDRLWKWSQFGALDNTRDEWVGKGNTFRKFRPGQDALRMCGEAGTMEREAARLRARADALSPPSELVSP